MVVTLCVLTQLCKWSLTGMLISCLVPCRFFFELYGAYKLGRAETDPSQSWYKGEIGFYDFYIIPLAKKLDMCGVFGVSSDEYLNYAQLNRDEWEREGEKMVEEFKQKYYAKFPEHKFLPAGKPSS